MEQARALSAQAVSSQLFGSLASGFFRWHHKIYYALAVGECTVAFPVEGDGKVSRCGQVDIQPGDSVEIINPKDLDITNVVWSD